MSTNNLLHKSHSNNEQPKKGIGGGTVFFEDASYTLLVYSIGSLSALCLLQPYGLIVWLSETPSIFSTGGVHNTFRPLTEEGEADGRLRRV